MLRSNEIITTAEECATFIKKFPKRANREIVFNTLHNTENAEEAVPYSTFFSRKFQDQLGYKVAVGSGNA